MMLKMPHYDFLSDVLRDAIALGEQQFGTSDQPRDVTRDPEPVFSSLPTGARPSISDQTNVENLFDFSFTNFPIFILFNNIILMQNCTS